MNESDRKLIIVSLLLAILFLSGDLVSAFVGIASPPPYSMNFATINTVGPATSVHNLFGVNSTIYCTGVTSTGITVRSATPRVQVSFLYKINDQNVTGQIINVIPEFTTNASLQKTFGVGACDRCGSNLNCIANQAGYAAYTQLQPQYFPTTGVYFATIGVQTGPSGVGGGTFGNPSVTLYAYLDIQPISTNVKIIVSQNTQPPNLAVIELV